MHEALERTVDNRGMHARKHPRDGIADAPAVSRCTCAPATHEPSGAYSDVRQRRAPASESCHRSCESSSRRASDRPP